MKKSLAAVASLAALAAFGLSACATTPTSGVEEGDGPATSQTTEPDTTTADDTTADDSTTDDTATDETTADEGAEGADYDEEEPAEPAPANFHQKYTYEDGVQIEVTKIKHSKVTRYDAEIIDDKDVAKAGDPVVYLEVRVKNGSKTSIDAYGSFTMTYGADGMEAPTSYLPDGKETTDMSGKILPGKSKTASENFMIPAKSQGDVVLEFSPDMDHESAIFSGSVK